MAFSSAFFARYRRVVTGLLGGIFALSLSSCATNYRQITPVSGEVNQFNGKAVTRVMSPDSLVLVASFAREDFQYSAFDVEIKNQTNHPVQIDPTQFAIRPLGADQRVLSSVNSADHDGHFFGADPGQEALQIPRERDREIARIKRARITNTVLFTALIVGGIVASNKTNQRFDQYRNTRINLDLAYTALQAKRIVDQTSFANRMQRFDYELYRWNKLALKPTLLQPGQSVRGLVFLPKLHAANYLDLTYPASNNSTLGVLFRQELVRGR